MDNDAYVLGIDYGTDSVRALIVDARNGSEISSAVSHYARWKEGRFCDPAENRFRQHPLDHIEGLESSVREALTLASVNVASNIRGIAVDTTGSTPAPVNRDGIVLGLLDDFADNPNALFVLWKDHTAVGEAEEINDLAHGGAFEDFTRYVGGIYSSEWFWAKMLHVLRADPKVKEAAWSWVEHCDWVTGILTGNTNPLTMKRSRCAAGHKAMWHESFGGLPSREFLSALDSRLDGIRDHLYTETFTSDTVAGTLTGDWAERLGIPAGIPVAVGAFDAHMGAVGGAIRPYCLSRVMGTSTCDMIVAPMEDMGDRLIPGICGQVDGSIIPGMLGMEAGQSAFGDVYAWFRDVLAWPIRTVVPDAADVIDRIIPALAGEAASLPVDTGITALDWLNGRRTPDASQLLKGAITGLNLGSTAPAIFKALVEATAFGSLKIVERFEREGVAIKEVIALGGVAKKSPYVMQVLADVLDRPIQVVRSEQTCALGAAMFAATASGIYPSVEEAIAGMESGVEVEYEPDASRAGQYRELYDRYSRLGTFIEDDLLGRRNN